MTISGERTEQLYIFCHVTGFTGDFLSFTDVELIRFFHGALHLLSCIFCTSVCPQFLVLFYMVPSCMDFRRRFQRTYYASWDFMPSLRVTFCNKWHKALLHYVIKCCSKYQWVWDTDSCTGVHKEHLEWGEPRSARLRRSPASWRNTAAPRLSADWKLNKFSHRRVQSLYQSVIESLSLNAVKKCPYVTSESHTYLPVSVSSCVIVCCWKSQNGLFLLLLQRSIRQP